MNIDVVKQSIKNVFTPERVFIWSVAVLASATIAFIVVIYIIPPPEKSSLGDYETPQRIINADEDISNSLITIHLNDRVIIFGKRCVNRDSVQVLNYQSFIKIDPNTGMGIKTVPTSTRLIEERAGSGECIATQRTILMPDGIDQGIWRVDSIDQSTKDGTIKIWSTENFEVK